MKLFLILSSIVLLSIFGMPAAIAEKTSSKVCGGELCSNILRTCTAEDHKKPLNPPLTRGYHGPHLRVTDLQNNSIDVVEVDQQIGVTTDLANGKECNQPFVWIVQISDTKDNSVVFLGWISGIMTPGMGHSPSMMWMPEHKGDYDIQMFVWKSLDNPFVISPHVTTSLTVSETSYSSRGEIENEN